LEHITNKEIYAMFKKSTVRKTIRLNRLRWFGHIRSMEKNRIPRKILYMNLAMMRLRGRARNR
jgi:hypothetical protein